MTDWDDLAEWWLEEVRDPAYVDDVQPLLDALVEGLVGPSLDLGCGDGRMLGSLPAPAFGCDLTLQLLSKARTRSAGVVQCRLPSLDWLQPDAVEVAVACLVLEHVADVAEFFEAVARVVSPAGSLVAIANHPAYTSAGAGPVIDQSDGEVLWRWGSYMVESAAAEPAGADTVVFHHRPLGVLLTTAARAGWKLERMVEAGASDASIARMPSLAGQEHMPRLVGLRWSKAA